MLQRGMEESKKLVEKRADHPEQYNSTVLAVRPEQRGLSQVTGKDGNDHSRGDNMYGILGIVIVLIHTCTLFMGE